MFHNCDRLDLKLQHQFQFWYSPLTLKLFAQSAIAFCLLTSGKASAQVIRDNTLPQNSIVTPNGGIIEITGGTTSGTNLFHSFEEFSLNTGNTAFFDNAADINNIIGRVTGNNISDIDGLIRANGTADLFLINPNGIVFGENAALDIGGSFIGSTADSINFADGAEFSAVDPNTSPLLTVSIPTGLQYGQNNGEIEVEGAGNNLFIDPDTFTVDRGDRPSGLEVSEKTLALVGSNVFLEGGNLTATQGNIELGSVAEGTVELIPDRLGWKLGYDEIGTFKDIELSQAASLEASGNSGGRVMVKGDFVSLTDGSAILTDTLGDGTGGSLTIEAINTEISGSAENGFTSSLFANVDLGATGEGGNLLIETDSLFVGGGAQVNVNTFGLGNAGTLTVRANEIELFSVSDDEVYFSGLYAQADVGETGAGGDINIETDLLLLDDSAEINVNTFGDGDAGKITIQAQEIELLGSFGFGSAIFASADLDSTGNGGNLEIDTNKLLVTESSQINVSTFGEGDGGNLLVNANEIELNGTFDSLTTGLFANSEATGNGGNLEINTDQLLVINGAQAIAATFSEGDGGNLSVNANEIKLSGASEDGSPSGLFTAAQTDSTGNGGNLQIRTDLLDVDDTAQIAASTSGSGNAGDLQITARDINLSGSSSSILSNAFIDRGNGGKIAIATDNLSIQDGATISTSNFFSSEDDVAPGTGKAGDITIDARTVRLDSTVADSSSISASTNAQSGGNVTLNVGSIALDNGSQVTAETRGNGDGGNINISASQFDLNNQGQVSVNSTGLGQAGDIAIAANSLNLDRGEITATSIQSGGGEIDLVTDSITLDNNSLISTSVLDSTGGGGNIFIDNRNFIIGQNDSDLRADAVLGAGGNIQIYAQGIFFDADSEITASSEFGVDGIIEIDTTESNELGTVSLPSNISTPEAVIVSSCPVPESNTFVVLGSGGLPENPQQYLRGQTTWQDLRRFSDLSSNPDWNQGDNSVSVLETSERIPNKSIDSKSETIVESQSWIINHQGNIELIANAVPITPQASWQPTVECRF